MLTPITRLFIAVCLFILSIACAALAYWLPSWSGASWPLCFISGLVGSIIHPGMEEIERINAALKADNATR